MSGGHQGPALGALQGGQGSGEGMADGGGALLQQSRGVGGVTRGTSRRPPPPPGLSPSRIDKIIPGVIGTVFSLQPAAALRPGRRAEILRDSQCPQRHRVGLGGGGVWPQRVCRPEAILGG